MNPSTSAEPAADLPSGWPRPLTVAVVGAGPAGIYTADHLTAGTFVAAGAVSVDLVERLPVPFGLLRYGVAPDHVSIKSTGRTLGAVLARPDVRLFGNVEVGEDVTAAELRSAYDVVVYALGAKEDRRLGIPGEDLPGSISATSFVDWYNGHPDASVPDLSTMTSVAVVGVGNVAIDVARILLRDPEDLVATDVPHDVLAALRASTVTDVHVIGRRGPQHAKFTTKELRELGALDGVGIVVDDEQLPAAAPQGASGTVRRNLDVLREWTTRQLADPQRRLHLHFGARPVDIIGTDRVVGLVLERTSSEGVGTGLTWTLPVDTVIRSVGYQATVPDDVPFDDARHVIPTQDHRVLRGGELSPGEYAVGWVKRGPIGVIGTNRSDAKETVAGLLEDVPTLLARRPDEPTGIDDLLAARGVRFVDTDGWQAVAAAEVRHGEPHGRGTVKISDWEQLLDAAVS